MPILKTYLFLHTIIYDILLMSYKDTSKNLNNHLYFFQSFEIASTVNALAFQDYVFVISFLRFQYQVMYSNIKPLWRHDFSNFEDSHPHHLSHYLWLRQPPCIQYLADPTIPPNVRSDSLVPWCIYVSGDKSTNQILQWSNEKVLFLSLGVMIGNVIVDITKILTKRNEALKNVEPCK